MADIHLRSRRISPKAGLAAPLAREAERRTGTVHAIVQPAGPVDAGTRRRWQKESGIRLLDPVPDGAFLAALPADPATLRELVGPDKPLRWAGRLEPGDKLSETLAAGTVAGHARRAGGVAVVVLFFGDVRVPAQRAVLKRHGAPGAERVEPLNGWLVELPEKAVRALAGEDEVKWIEEVPPPATLDNDGARGATATNADATHAAPYNLTGAGVTVAQWETTHASLTHTDFAGRIVLGDGPLAVGERTVLHTESGAPNGTFQPGEAVYVDMDDSGTVSAGDVRGSVVGAFAVGSIVAGGDPDVGTALVPFAANEWFEDANADNRYAPGDPIYRDADNSQNVSVGDVRLTAVGAFAAGTSVAAGDPDVGRDLDPLEDPHDHATHVAGTVIGSGAGSAAFGGGPNQWKGVAPGATLRSYVASGALNADYLDAATNGATISTNSWGSSHMHQVASAAASYDASTALYDAVVSGRRSDGTPSGLPAPILVVGSSGNEGRPERHAENVGANAQFDTGESVYLDFFDSGTVNSGDVLISGPSQASGTALVDFRLDERHTDTSGVGTYQSSEAIYRDVDGSQTVTAGDVRLTAVGAFPAGSVVAAGDPDAGALLRPFRMWRTVRVPNSAKDTVVVGSVSSDTVRPDASSSRGPTLDGRLKPDVVGPGWQASGDLGITSALPRNRYGVKGGTSMATPAVSGVLALVTERYRQLCAGAQPAPHTLRALLVHAAEDRTTIPNVGTAFAGPDYTHGYGRARAKETVDLVPHHRTGSAAALGDTDYTFTVGTVAGLKVTLAWDDPAWAASAAPSPTTGFLQNDLDLVLIAPDGTQHTPWLLDPANPAQPATRQTFAAAAAIPASARDRRNTIEQVVVDAAAPGTWTVRVTASMLNLGPQPYTIVCEHIPPQDGPCSATPAADVWMRDNAGDTGTVPSAGTMWLSPDLWNRRDPDGLTTHENPEFGQTNHFYATLRNASAVTAQAVSVDVWIAPAAVGLAWPANFVYVGRFAAANVPPGVHQIGPLPWSPPDPTPSDHFCCYVRVQSPQDPITWVETASVSENARNSNNIVWRNVNVVDELLPNEDATFMVRNVAEDDADVELMVVVSKKVLGRGRVAIRLAPALERMMGERLRDVPGLGQPDPSDMVRFLAAERRLHRGIEEARVAAPLRPIVEPEVRLPAVRLKPGAAFPVTLRFGAERALTGENIVDVVQVVDGEAVGGVRYVVRTKRGFKPPR